jgi:hypothetical protein
MADLRNLTVLFLDRNLRGATTNTNQKIFWLSVVPAISISLVATPSSETLLFNVHIFLDFFVVNFFLLGTFDALLVVE